MSRRLIFIPTSDTELPSNATNPMYFATESQSTPSSSANASNLYQHLGEEDEDTYIYCTDGAPHDKNTYSGSATVYITGQIPNIAGCHIVSAILKCRHYHQHKSGNKKSTITQKLSYKIGSGTKQTITLADYDTAFQTQEVADLTSQLSIGQNVNCRIDLEASIARSNPNSPKCTTYFSSVFIEIVIDGEFTVTASNILGLGEVTGLGVYHLDDYVTITFKGRNNAYCKELQRDNVDVTSNVKRGLAYEAGYIDQSYNFNLVKFSNYKPPEIHFGGSVLVVREHQKIV